MARWTGTWLSGLGAAGITVRAAGSWPGERLGLPEEGTGSAVGFGPRLGAVLVDVLVAALIGALLNRFVRSPDFGTRQGASVGALLLIYTALLPTAGQTFGMRLLRLRVVRVAGGGPLSVGAAFVRAVLVVLTVPALFTDRDGRGWHDRAVGSVVVRSGARPSLRGS
ncbi:MAG: RDD family protein [Mycobacteriales bacterium]